MWFDGQYDCRMFVLSFGESNLRSHTMVRFQTQVNRVRSGLFRQRPLVKILVSARAPLSGSDAVPDHVLAKNLSGRNRGGCDF